MQKRLKMSPALAVEWVSMLIAFLSELFHFGIVCLLL